jgi:hypothetical protein
MGSGSSGGHDPMMHPGDSVKAHASDKIVSGRISKVSRDRVAIESSQGQKKTLQLVPETAILIDGQDAQRNELKEGQEVRASYNNVEGKDVAVQIEAGQHGSSGSSGTGSSGSTHGGSMSEPGGSGRSGSDPDAASGTTGDPSTTEPKPAGSSDTKRRGGGGAGGGGGAM